MYFEKFETRITKEFKSILVPILSGDRAHEYFTSIGMFLFREGPRNPITRTRSSREEFIGSLFEGFHEISTPYYTLRDIETLLKNLRARSSSLLKSRILTYHVHSYLNENYILEKRLISYPKQIMRSLKDKSKSALRLVDEMEQVTQAAFRPLNATRGAHVHRRRFDDEDISRLSMLERVSFEDHPDLQRYFEEYYRAEFGITKYTWLDRIRSNNDAILKFLDTYFEILYPEIFDDRDQLRLPKHISGV